MFSQNFLNKQFSFCDRKFAKTKLMFYKQNWEIRKYCNVMRDDRYKISICVFVIIFIRVMHFFQKEERYKQKTSPCISFIRFKSNLRFIFIIIDLNKSQKMKFPNLESELMEWYNYFLKGKLNLIFYIEILYFKVSSSF